MRKAFLFIMLLFFPLIVNASTDKYYIEANIQTNGDMHVKELKILNGKYNGAKTSLSYWNPSLTFFTGKDSDFEGSSIYNAYAIEDVKIYGVKYTNKNFDIINSADREEFTKNQSADNGSYGYYAEYLYNNYKIFMPSSYNQAFLITYTLKNVVVVHEDVAEIAWDFIGKNYEEDINELKIVVNLPKDSKELRVFSHGPLVGSNKINTKRQVEATYPKLYAGYAVDMRVVFDKEIVPFSEKKSNVKALDKILKVEENRANKANQIRKEALKVRQMAIIHASITTIIIALSAYIYYRKHDKEHFSDFHAKYYREFTGDYNVEVIDYLMNKIITPNAMSASILNLVYKKKVKVEKIKDGKKDIYSFTKLEDSDSATEMSLMNFLFNNVGNGTNFTDAQLKAYAKSTKTYHIFTSSYDSWKELVIIEGEKEMFWEKTRKKIVYIFLSLVNLGIFYLYHYLRINEPINSWLIFMIVLTLMFAIYIGTAKKRTKKGNEHYLKWQAFKNFLKDFGQFKTKDLPEIILWERYLVYATIFGLASRVQAAMNVKIKEMEVGGQVYPTFSTFDYINLSNAINNSVATAVRQAQYTAAAVASSSSSSSGGFGGGSSYGGGGFGGGGSGGGRF